MGYTCDVTEITKGRVFFASHTIHSQNRNPTDEKDGDDIFLNIQRQRRVIILSIARFCLKRHHLFILFIRQNEYCTVRDHHTAWNHYLENRIFGDSKESTTPL
jgi:hypothetical protein